ncbi:hypothetical protein CMV_006761 [Castanea mollissima]|uniref:Uncharacterized protein n=1 Tax=Castanea mollissima TaxID=60419 RepID=A0A8J4RNH2_9ROSI|nr:hypothetical protein CMV_006761 [Castanea mollissima]
MSKSYLHWKSPFEALCSLGLPSSCYILLRASFFDKIDKYFLNCPSEEELERVEKIARVLKPFYDITVRCGFGRSLLQLKLVLLVV